MIRVISSVEIFISIVAIFFFEQGVLTDSGGVFSRFKDISAVTVGMGGRREYWISVLKIAVKLIKIRVCKINRTTQTWSIIKTNRQKHRSIVL